MFNRPNSKPNFFELEEEILKYWKQNKTFEKTIENRKDSKDFIFYDGPPFMSGMPHYATLLSSLPKDVIPRYKTMKGNKVERVWGWDCHGLPIENKVEKELGLKGPKEIEKFGLEAFIQKCYEWNRVGIDNWRWYIDHIGRWADLDNAYRTLDQDFMESTWWTFKEIWDKGLVYKGKRVSMFSTDSSTPVSNFEVSMDPDNYQDTEDTAVTVKFKLKEDSRLKLKLKINNDNPTYLLAWTTTPWTLPSNFALAVNPKAKYVVVNVENENLVLNSERLEATMLNSKKDHTKIADVSSDDLNGLEYEQLYNFLPGKENDFKVYQSEYVTTEDGTGILHIAPAFGEADFNMGKEFNLSDLSDIDEEGKLIVGPWKGIYLRGANKDIVKDLLDSNKLFKDEIYKHRLPYYRYKNPLIYKAQENYFINVQKLKNNLIESNKEITWIPEHFKLGRFQNVLETAPDWSISRSRYWGTAMPVWRNEEGEEIVVGSRDELMKLVNEGNTSQKIQKVVLNLLPEDKNSYEALAQKVNTFIKSKDEILNIESSQANLSKLREEFLGETHQESEVKYLKTNEIRSYYLLNGKALDLHRPYIDSVIIIKDGKEYKRISETMDVWMDSGSMPFAQFHYPFVNKEKFEQSFPGDFIAEYTGQIRAWFYVLHVISNALFSKPAFKNVLVTGVLAGTDGRKMSKSYGNYPDPKETIIKYGGEALRLYFLTSTLMSGNDMSFNEKDLRLQTQEFILPLWNIYTYLITYANIHSWEPRAELVYNKRKNFDDSHPWDHMPFDNITNEMDSWILLRLQNTIHNVTTYLDGYQIPKALKEIKSLIEDVSKWYIRLNRDRFVEGQQSTLDILYYVFIEIAKLLAPLTPFLADKFYQELVNSKVTGVPESIHLTDYPEADLKFIEEYSALENEMEFVRKICELGNTIRTTAGIKVRQPLAAVYIQNTNKDVPSLSSWMQEIIMRELNVKELEEKANLQSSNSAEDTGMGLVVALNTELTEELKAEGIFREFTRSVQAQRKNIGLNPEDYIKLIVGSNEEFRTLLSKNEAKVKETLKAKEIELLDSVEGTETEIEQYKFTIKITKI